MWSVGLWKVFRSLRWSPHGWDCGALLRRDQRPSLFSSHHVRIQRKAESLQPERQLSPEPNHAGINF